MAINNGAANNSGKLTIGPLLFHWKPEVWRDFYFSLADEAPIDTVYLGEVVCGKRSSFVLPYMEEVVERLTGAGKKVAFSTLALVMNKMEREAVRAVATNHDALVEINDMSALPHLDGSDFVIGPHINCFNEEALAYFAGKGAVRFCPPIELPMPSLGLLAKQADKLGVEIEMLAYGRMQLAVSARCYHARAHKISKDSCQFVCGEDADGLSLKTLDDEDFLTINGIQTMSHACLNLLDDLAALKNLGINSFRLSPHSCDMVKVSELFRSVLDETISGQEANNILREISFDAPFSNGYLHGKPGVEWSDGKVG